MATETSFNIPTIILDNTLISPRNESVDLDKRNNDEEEASMELFSQTEDNQKIQDECAKQINDELTKSVKNMFKQKKRQQPDKRHTTANICGICRQVV
ncbi:hypothetical protein FB639_002345, partial [Coemansia asiatica]